eukprot:m.58045 g.58045  ORF g.58045 m.58045 type:complete len:883 (+) comp22488_c0_seq2:20-2668(+)
MSFRSLAFVTTLVCAASLAAADVDSDAAKLKNPGNVGAVYDLLDRVLPNSKSHFVLQIQAGDCGSVAPPCFTLSDTADTLTVSGTTAAELTLGVGHYMREYCNMTIGWKRGGGSNVFIPPVWPKVGMDVSIRRTTPWSYIMNVCTHSYSLVWYSWADWSEFIDWMALSGINLFLAMTGQEEVQYKVFLKFGLNDTEIRNWFNGPAFLTWSRGQNEYGNDIAGELPRSWMQDQWELQKQIIQRYRSLGMSAQLPGFQGNVPLALKTIHKDANITKQGDTGWMTSTDPLFAKIADAWMEQLIADFGTDHWYQLDGYFNGGTAPWMASRDLEAGHEHDVAQLDALPACEWGPLQSDTYIAGCDSGCESFAEVADAKAACEKDDGCGGITLSGKAPMKWQLRSANNAQKSPVMAESSYLITNAAACHSVPTDAGWGRRGAAAYMGLNRTDPDAIWSFQGWAFVGWQSQQQATYLKSFIDATPPGKFNVIDMSTNGEGEWKKWNNASFWGANFVWTTLHDFGGTDGLKGDLDRINDIPFGAKMPEVEKETGVWGTGFTPEGIDQNPVYYEFMLEASYRTAKVANITNHIIARSLRRYGLSEYNADVASAWSLLVSTAYSQDLSVQDGTGVPHLGGHEGWSWNADRHTPTQPLCNIYQAWGDLINVGEQFPKTAALDTYTYDLANTGREILAQLAGPSGQNFTDSTGKATMVPADVRATGMYYYQVLNDVDALVATNAGFLLGPWIEMARYFGANSTDCSGGPKFPTVTTCPDFYEWNARVQLTTWNPTPVDSKTIPGGPIDYASKHWSGLISDYYAERVKLVMNQALTDAAAGKPLDSKAVAAIEAAHAYTWTTATNKYPTEIVGDPLTVAKGMYTKYAPYFASCSM